MINICQPLHDPMLLKNVAFLKISTSSSKLKFRSNHMLMRRTDLSWKGILWYSKHTSVRLLKWTIAICSEETKNPFLFLLLRSQWNSIVDSNLMGKLHFRWLATGLMSQLILPEFQFIRSSGASNTSQVYMKRAEVPILGPSLHLEMCPPIVMSQILFILCGHIAFYLKLLNSKGKAKHAFLNKFIKCEVKQVGHCQRE